MSERIVPTGSPENMPFRIEPKEPRKVEESSSSDSKAEQESDTDTFESTQDPEKEEAPIKKDDKEKDQKAQSAKKSDEGLDIYA